MLEHLEQGISQRKEEEILLILLIARQHLSAWSSRHFLVYLQNFHSQESTHIGADLVGLCSGECFQHTLFPVIFQDRFGLVFVHLQPLDKCLWSIILMLNQRLAGHITHASHFWRFEFKVVDVPAACMDPASRKALLDDLRGHVQVQHQV